jgi:hypothetical protein
MWLSAHKRVRAWSCVAPLSLSPACSFSGASGQPFGRRFHASQVFCGTVCAMSFLSRLLWKDYCGQWASWGAECVLVSMPAWALASLVGKSCPACKAPLPHIYRATIMPGRQKQRFRSIAVDSRMKTVFIFSSSSKMQMIVFRIESHQ